MKSRFLIISTWDRIALASPAQACMLSTSPNMKALSMEMTMDSTIVMGKLGIVTITLVMSISTASTLPPSSPDTTPTVQAMVIEITPAKKATRSTSLAPRISWIRVSLPE